MFLMFLIHDDRELAPRIRHEFCDLKSLSSEYHRELCPRIEMADSMNDGVLDMLPGDTAATQTQH